MRKLFVAASFIATIMNVSAGTDLEKRVADLEKRVARLDVIEKRLEATDKIAKAVAKQVRSLKLANSPKNDLGDVAVGDMFEKSEKAYDKAEKRRQKKNAETAALENEEKALMNMDDPFEANGKVRPYESKKQERLKKKWNVKNDNSELDGAFDLTNSEPSMP